MNLPNPIAQTKNLLLKINENLTSKEEFDLEYETFQFNDYYNKNTYNNKWIPSIVFNAVKDEKLIKNYLSWSKLKQRKYEKDFMKIDHLKKETGELFIKNRGRWR